MDFSQELHIEMSQWKLYRCFGFHKFHSGKSIHFILYTFNRAIIQLPKLNGFLNWSSSFMVTCSYRSYYHIIWATYYYSQIWNKCNFWWISLPNYVWGDQLAVWSLQFAQNIIPKGSMYGTFTYIWLIRIYTIWLIRLYNHIVYIYICINQM